MSLTDLQTFIDGWDLFRMPSLAGALAGAMLGLLGVYIILRRMVFLSAAVSQTAGLGVAVSFFAQVHWGLPAFLASPLLGAATLTFLTVILVARHRDNPRVVSQDSALGMAYLLGAAGTLAIGTRIVQEMHDIESLLFGSAAVVLPEQFYTLLGVATATLAIHAWWWRGLSAVAFDRDGAHVRGMPTRLIEFVFFATLALAVAVTTQVLGALPTFAFSVLPALCALRLSPNVPTALVVASIIGAVVGFGGYVLAFVCHLPVGASQTLLALGTTAIVEAAYQLRAKVKIAILSKA